MEYMDDKLRVGKTDTKGTAHMAHPESENLGGLTRMISKLTESREWAKTLVRLSE